MNRNKQEESELDQQPSAAPSGRDTEDPKFDDSDVEVGRAHGRQEQTEDGEDVVELGEGDVLDEEENEDLEEDDDDEDDDTVAPEPGGMA